MDENVPGQKAAQPRTLSNPVLEKVFEHRLPEPVSFVNSIINECINLSASDILFEPRRENLIVRARIDGVIYELGNISTDAYSQVSSRIKVLSKLDPTEKKKIQEGQFTVDYKGRMVNLRVEIAQTIHGELIVIRIHERRTIVMELSSLGLSKLAYEGYQKILSQRSGLVLVSGPTGCGKTTTLYSTLSKLNENNNYNVMTIEDPVEFQLEGINQMQTEEDTGFTFAVGLRTILRLSPDIVFVGEIRDRETAKIAVESGLTGQLVLSTVHAEDSIGALFRLLDLGIETYLLNSSLTGIVAQRLVRKVCEKCSHPYAGSQDEIDLFQKIMDKPPKQLVKGKGCPECKNLGYKGRTGIFEVLVIDARVRSLIRSKVNEDMLRNTLIDEGFANLLKNGLEKCEKGLTTTDEVMRNSLKVI